MKIAVLLVTFNRLSCLKIALSKYENQLLKPNDIIVVDNASTDGTREYLKKWKTSDVGISKYVIRNEKNLGGSGGFYTGLKFSLSIDYDYIFLADDDAFAEQNTFSSLFSNLSLISEKNTVALCTSVINNGVIDISHRCRIRKSLFSLSLNWVPEEEYRKNCFKLDIVTFVGAAIKKSTIEHIGLPLKEYFIYYDDTEYFMRIKKLGNIYCIPKSIMVHNTNGTLSINSWKGYYDTRNWLDAIYRHYGVFRLIQASIIVYIKRCSVIAKIFRNRDPNFRKMCRFAIIDAINHKLGLSQNYHPK